MNFKERQNAVSKILGEAVIEGQHVMVVGSGVWFLALEQTLLRELIRGYSSEIFTAEFEPALAVAFGHGGILQLVDFREHGRNLQLLNRDGNNVPDTIYLVEDAPGANVGCWKELVQPFIHKTSCRVLPLGAQSADAS